MDQMIKDMYLYYKYSEEDMKKLKEEEAMQ